MKPVGAIALKAVTVAEGFAAAATREVGENRGKQVEAFLKSVNLTPGNPWCAAFVRHCEEKSAGFIHKTIPVDYPDSGYCPDFANWAKKNGLWIPVASVKNGTEKVQRGDMVLFYFAAKNRVAHTGLVTGTFTGGVSTVEGNTSDGTGVDRDGDGVFERQRTFAQLGTYGGFVRLPF